jgi:3-methyladenine DNA glycosylase AlkC
MKGRMGREERRDQLLRILTMRYAEARSHAEFTASSLAHEAGVSAVWFYALVGEQFRRLRSKLPCPAPPAETLLTKLNKEVMELRDLLKELKAKYEMIIKEKLAEAIRHIELLDNENRMLREKLAVFEKRLSDEKLIICDGAQNETVVSHQDPI